MQRNQKIDAQKNAMQKIFDESMRKQLEDLKKQYAAFQRAQRHSAVQIGKISKSGLDEQVSLADTPKKQMVEELMVEYLKMTLGKPTPVVKQFSLLPSIIPESTKPAPADS